jgi:hypothetical protein
MNTTLVKNWSVTIDQAKRIRFPRARTIGKIAMDRRAIIARIRKIVPVRLVVRNARTAPAVSAVAACRTAIAPMTAAAATHEGPKSASPI